MSVIPLLVALQLSSAIQAPPPPQDIPLSQRYRMVLDYHLPRGADTLLWINFVIDQDKWPKRREVGISRTGLVFVLEWASQTRGRLTPLRLFPHEVRELFDLIENKVGFSQLRSKPRGKQEPDYLAANFEYGLPSRTGGSHAVFDDMAVQVAPIVHRLEQMFQGAQSVWKEKDPGYGPPSAGWLETEDNAFLPHMLSLLHENGTLQEVTSPKAR